MSARGKDEGEKVSAHICNDHHGYVIEVQRDKGRIIGNLGVSHWKYFKEYLLENESNRSG